MDKPKATPKDFFLWAGAMIALYWSVISFIFLIYNYIDYTFPVPLAFVPVDPYQGGVGYEMASIIVMLPVYFLLMWFIRRDIKHDHSRKNIWVRRWALIVTLFVTGLTIAIDLITVLTTFLNGESFTLSFALKALLVLLVAAGGFMHFIADFRGYWGEYPERRRNVGIAVAVLAVISIGSGFFIIGTPAQAMAYREDEQKVSDLQMIQSDVVSYWQQSGKLPASLDQIGQPLTGGTMPVDEQTGKEYEYMVVGQTSFKLCANFNAVTAPYAITQNEITAPMPAGVGGTVQLSDSWYHDAGNQCFLRVINPQQYPRLKAAP
ncbi:MAG TPA: DUF5671 domain-containing protein [Candidatus Paceibacterota bacterium]|jgi:hypothetical protein|nr:DUF5671 domain-containing protein [Candidatus Paceibacterota bacterium]